jgi:hypothetical protein
MGVVGTVAPGMYDSGNTSGRGSLMALYRVEVEEHRTWIIYVDADDDASAEAEAEELASSLEPDDVDYYTYAAEIDIVPNSAEAEVWVGGDEGEFIPHAEYKAGRA